MLATAGTGHFFNLVTKAVLKECITNREIIDLFGTDKSRHFS
jgi:hypothetical protein